MGPEERERLWQELEQLIARIREGQFTPVCLRQDGPGGGFHVPAHRSVRRGNGVRSLQQLFPDAGRIL